jgi:hypothetical protein
MLGNKDFAALIKSGADLSTSGEKVRFDLKQIRRWDKEINKQSSVAKRRNPFEKNSGEVGATGDNSGTAAAAATSAAASFWSKTPSGNLYRDRALERRLDKLPASEEGTIDRDLQERIAHLDAEQTKFIGGDLEHTHLVKGLDFALLQKNRSAEKSRKGDD